MAAKRERSRASAGAHKIGFLPLFLKQQFSRLLLSRRCRRGQFGPTWSVQRFLPAPCSVWPQSRGRGGHRPSRKARGEQEEGFFEGPDVSHEEVPAVLGGEALLWDLGPQGPPEGRRQRQAEGSWQSLKTSSERTTFAQREGRAGRGPFPSPRICPALSKHQLIFLTPR